MASVGKPVPHDSARGHVTGAADFVDDLTPMAGELHVGFVGSPVACGKLRGVDVAAARRVEGVVALLTAADVAGQNTFGPLIHDEPFLPRENVEYRGQPVVVAAAESRQALRRARRAVVLDVEEHAAVLTIDDAVAAGRFLGPPRRIRRGEPEQAIENAPRVLSGTFECGGQEQFYLESQAAIAYPGEDGQLVVHSSTQNPSEIQLVVAEVLGLSLHQVVCVCKRMGGAFGGKETQAALPALMAALVAQQTGRAARVVYDKDDDMRVTGKRHACQVRWRGGFDEAGVITGLTIDLYSNGGAYMDLSMAVLERGMLHAENVYYIPHIEINGRVCFTNLPPNTAFRGFGGPQSMAAMENIIETIAFTLGQDAYDVRLRNLYGVGERNITPYGQVFERNHLPELFTSLAARSRYKQRLARVKRQNATSRTHLHGISMTGVKFGISFTTGFLNQANALVNVFTDGTVQVSTGGTEMGQGLNVKIRQLVADEFAIDPAGVLVMTTSTEKNHNTSPTAASASTDLNGAAAVRACRQIKRAMRPFAAELFADPEEGIAPSPRHVRFENGDVFDARRPENRLPFGEFAARARRGRVNLGARGFYATPGVEFNRETGRGNPFFYFTQGAAAAEVVIDRFTGELRVPRVDLLIDIGRSINPGVDRGQVIGGFIQGMGWVTTEELVYDDGELLSYSPTTYKIPASSDVPEVFNVDFFDNTDNVQNIRASKAVGEPPLMMAICVWTAVKHALSFVGGGGNLRIPATTEEIMTRLSETETVVACEEVESEI